MTKRKEPPRSQSEFSRFFKNATKKQREEFFKQVAEKAIEEQNKVLEETSQSCTPTS